MSAAKRIPAVYVNHGGGPMPVLGMQPNVATNLKNIAASLPKPKAIVVVSAHYESTPLSIMTAERPGMYYDYRGFPPESYKLRYDAPGSPELAQRLGKALEAINVPYHPDPDRDYDHGMFIPLMLMYPDADIPVLGVSVPSEPQTLWKLGVALRELREEGVLVIGSGASFHNFGAFFRSDKRGKDEDRRKSLLWDSWLRETATHPDPDERRTRLMKWEEAPHALFAHPTPDHFTPLVVVAAAAGNDTGKAVSPQSKAGLCVSQFIYGQ